MKNSNNLVRPKKQEEYINDMDGANIKMGIEYLADTIFNIYEHWSANKLNKKNKQQKEE